MNNINLNDQVYAKAMRVATAQGYESVEAYITDVVEGDLMFEAGVPDSFFTPEVMSAIDEGIADADAGRLHSLDEVRKHFNDKSSEWRRDQAS